MWSKLLRKGYRYTFTDFKNSVLYKTLGGCLTKSWNLFSTYSNKIKQNQKLLFPVTYHSRLPAKRGWMWRSPIALGPSGKASWALWFFCIRLPGVEGHPKMRRGLGWHFYLFARPEASVAVAFFSQQVILTSVPCLSPSCFFSICRFAIVKRSQLLTSNELTVCIRPDSCQTSNAASKSFKSCEWVPYSEDLRVILISSTNRGWPLKHCRTTRDAILRPSPSDAYVGATGIL